MNWFRHSFLLAVTMFAAALNTSAQGTFQNLGFESATLVPIPGDPFGRVQFAQAFPGWTGTEGAFPATNALHNGTFLDTAGISIIDKNWSSTAEGFPAQTGLIEGNYTALLFSGTLTNTQTGVDTSLSQTGLVPVNSMSLLFKAEEVFYPSGSLVVTLGGQALSVVTLGSGVNYTLYGADIAPWAGQSEQLSFTVLGNNPHVDDEYVFLDSIQFSSTPIPEPGTWALHCCGAVLFAMRRWIRQCK